MKLYGSTRGVNPRRVRMFLIEQGIESVEHVAVDLRAGENRSDAFRAMSPYMRVPVLELASGDYLCESIAICRYLDGKYPRTPSLFGAPGRDAAEVEQWMRFMEFEFQQPVSMAFRHTTGVFSDREPVVREWGEKNLARVPACFQFLDQRIRGRRRWLAGERFSMADLVAVCAADQAQELGVEIAREQHGLKGWYERCRERPSYAA